MPKGALGGNLALHVLSFHWRAGSALLGAQLSSKWQVQATAHRKAYASLVHGSSTSRGLHCKNKSWRLLLHCPQTRLQLYHLALLCEIQSPHRKCSQTELECSNPERHDKVNVYQASSSQHMFTQYLLNVIHSFTFWTISISSSSPSMLSILILN